MAPQSMGNEECMDQVGEALIGAYARSEGGLFSAWQLYKCLQGSSQLSVDSEQTEVEPALSHLAFGSVKRFKGRTPSYDEFYETEVQGQSGYDKVLVVHYEEYGWAEYRRSSIGLERCYR